MPAAWFALAGKPKALIPSPSGAGTEFAVARSDDINTTVSGAGAMNPFAFRNLTVRFETDPSSAYPFNRCFSNRQGRYVAKGLTPIAPFTGLGRC